MLELLRLVETPFQTTGIFRFDNILLCYALELGNKENQPFVSRIPAGTYRYERYDSGKYKVPCFRIHNVYTRTNICIHPANKVSELMGCIAPGIESNEFGVTASRHALAKLRNIIPDKGTIKISEHF